MIFKKHSDIKTTILLITNKQSNSTNSYNKKTNLKRLYKTSLILLIIKKKKDNRNTVAFCQL